MTIALVCLTLVLAAANGANDISKGIATLVGAGVASSRAAVLWGVGTTAAGGIVAAYVTQGLVRTFSGKGVLSAEDFTPAFYLSVACGAVLWLVVATWTGFPVSTTHSLFGALVGAAIARDGVGGVLWSSAIMKIALPLLVSPLAALILVVLVYPFTRRAFERAKSYCICIERSPGAVLAAPHGAAAMPVDGSAEILTVGSACAESVIRLNVMDSLHWLSAGATSFFRGLNDTPKILAIGIVATASGALSVGALYSLVAGAMALGGLYAGVRVIQTLSERVTTIDHEGGLAANAVTSLLVGLASRSALPVSTTHVSTGAIAGIGVTRGGRSVQWRVVWGILVAWIVTLPVSAILAAVVFGILRT